MEKRWKMPVWDANAVLQLQSSLKVNQVICQILVQRGIDNFEKAKQFFRPQLTDLHSPWLMKDMDKAVQRILNAFQQNEKILVYGDYDVDGTTSVACMFRFLQSVYPNVAFYIPHRYREGYGVSQQGIHYAQEHGFSLIISLDCGIKSIELIQYAKDLSIDFIVCDHHLPDKQLPPAVAILNPKQKNCAYPYKELCGCGVGFKLITALAEKLGLSDTIPFQYIDLVACAIAADIVPLTGENRTLAYFGLKKVNENPCIGIKALLQLAGIQKELHINNLVFIIAPRVNAAGRMDDAKKAVQLFIEQDMQAALQLAEMLHNDNTDRKEADTTITAEALSLIQDDANHTHKKTTVVYQEHWHKGVVGIVASRLIEKHYRPTIVLTKSGEYLTGSARSVAGFNLYEAIHACRDYLIGYGGHFAAAGLTLKPENLITFSNAFEAIVNETIDPDLLTPEIIVDAVITLNDITMGFYNIICQMEPFGPENMQPVFMIEKLTDTGYSKIVKEEHIRFVLKQNNSTITGIGFNMAHFFSLLESQQPIDIVCTIDLNEYMGEKKLQLRVMDIRPSK
ncbi:MAG: single-stranded-DNA-specific exonuclease RecJ [Hydrotalea flava]|uniref:single-stranded-DNA-specific exonuclease RecJ n=1 Tax=Hydrotalea TaxID=1004300 RepID=UPI00094340D4|nr:MULTISPECIES: single-stranded-DNA-specific exonuclease RecJ [Hydrotalea]MBY0347952.1 single-stranded-DNA-specific exonuclease RecJ [Hydrotalea flava]RWZ90232.1 MAG: single-stranded-DNA-specific exonuclease RecJ [Hydrotalea sp. AMD]